MLVVLDVEEVGVVLPKALPPNAGLLAKEKLPNIDPVVAVVVGAVVEETVPKILLFCPPNTDDVCENILGDVAVDVVAAVVASATVVVVGDNPNEGLIVGVVKLNIDCEEAVVVATGDSGWAVGANGDLTSTLDEVFVAVEEVNMVDSTVVLPKIEGAVVEFAL